MAPLSSRIAHAMYDFKVEPRGLGSNNSTNAQQSLTPSEGFTLQALAVTFATISVASSILAFYWFIKMRRSFRHDLIMLLIQSDMFKALWFMIYPIVVFTKGPVPNESTFCKVNGLFLAIGIEASDVAVLMIAIHSALYIFKPRASSGEGGLYPYRHFAYIVWFFFPIVMASLAFINGSGAYVNQGTYCYLPVRPFWYRLALSWIPRYIIFIFIVLIYASIYYYVRNKFHGFNKEEKIRPERETGSSNRNKRVRRSKRNSIPPTPTLACHGLIGPSRQASVATDSEARKQSISTLNSIHGAPLARTGTLRFIWSSVLANHDSSQTPPSELSTVDSDSLIGPSLPRPLPAHLGSPSPRNDVESVDPFQSRVTSWRDSLVHRVTFSPGQFPKSKRSIADLCGILSRGPPDMPTENPTPVSPLQLMNSRGQNLAISEMLRTREKIRRQLRFLFIYPLVYMGMWVVPFVSHALQYDDRFAMNTPFGLTCATTIFVCSQAAVDCWLFSTREQPWKHIPGSDGSFWGSLRFWSGWHGVRRRRRKFYGPGKTREEMVREARAAYQRREQELAQRRLEAVQGARSGEYTRGRSWWEAAGLDGAMSTVHEERSNQMEEVEASWGDEMDSTHIGKQLSRQRSQGKEEESREATSKKVSEKDGSST